MLLHKTSRLEDASTSCNKNINTNTTLNYSVLGLNKGSDNPDKYIIQGLDGLLAEHVGRLQAAIRRHEAYSLKPFPRYMNQKEVIDSLGHEKIFWILVEEYGLKPIREGHKFNIYSTKQVEEKCIQFELNIAA
jgi:hypothetical protein